MLKPFQNMLNNPAPKKLIIIHLLNTHIKYKYRYPKNQSKFNSNTNHIPPKLSAKKLKSYNNYNNANLYNNHIIASLIKNFKAANPNKFLIYFSNHNKKIYNTPPHKTQKHNKNNPTHHIYTIPFLL